MSEGNDPGTPTPQEPPRRETPTARQESTASGTTPSPAPWQLLVMGGGAAMLIGSFIKWLSLEDTTQDGTKVDESWNAWSNIPGLFPLSTLVVLIGVAVAAQVALTLYTTTKTPDRVSGFDWHQLRLLAGGLTTLTMLSYLILKIESPVERGTGIYLALAGAIGLLVGALMERGERGGDTPAATLKRRDPTQGDWIVLAAGVAIVVGSFLDMFDKDSAWSGGMFPLYTLPAILGAVMAGWIAVARFSSMAVPDRVLGLTMNQIQLAFGTWAGMMMVAFLVQKTGIEIAGSQNSVDKEIGFWIMLAGAVGLAIGAYMRDREATGVRPTA